MAMGSRKGSGRSVANWMAKRREWMGSLLSRPSHGTRRPPETILPHSEVGSSRTAKAQDHGDPRAAPAEFDTPKPLGLLEWVLQVATDPNAVVLDSFAGSGTTAHAVLAANKKDNGTRRFILVESEDYADALTAERVRRVIKRLLIPRHSARRAISRKALAIQLQARGDGA